MRSQDYYKYVHFNSKFRDCELSHLIEQYSLDDLMQLLVKLPYHFELSPRFHLKSFSYRAY